GLVLPVGETLQVIVTRIVQATDPNPTVSTTTYTLSASGATIQAAATWTVNVFKPSITIGLGVNTTSAKVGDTLTYTVTVHNTSTTNSPDLVANFQTSTLLSNVLISGVARGRVSVADLTHLFVGGVVFGPGLRPNRTNIALH